MADEKDFRVLRQHEGDKTYTAGMTRTARPEDVAHLVRMGVLADPTATKAEQPTANKAEAPLTNKAEAGAATGAATGATPNQTNRAARSR